MKTRLNQRSRVGYKGLAFLTLCAFAGFILVGPLSFAAPPEGKGNAGDNGNGNGNGNGNAGDPPGQQKKADSSPGNSSSAPGRSDRSEVGGGSGGGSSRSEEVKLERTHPHQDRGALTSADQGNSSHAKGLDHGIRGREAAKAHVDNLLKSLNKFEHARWDYNPKDTRGQGNMGKVNMRDPYGFDKDSGREGSERGRAIHIREPEVLDLASLLTFTWGITDMWVMYYQNMINWFNSLSPTNPYYTYYYNYYSRYLSAWEESIVYHLNKPYTEIVTNWSGQTIDYTLSLGNVPSSFEGDTLLVSFNLVSLRDYTGTAWTSTQTWTGRYWQTTWTQTPIQYDSGQTVVSQTQEVALTDSGTFTFSYDPPDDGLVSTYGASGTGNWFEASVTVTDPVSGSSVTYTFDEQLYVWRCPYGIVYDTETKRPIAGAVVTIHNADGSIAVLDKAANPNVSNPQKTDATGRYNAKLAVGKKYYLTVKVPGYEEYRSPLFSERWHIVREDVGMMPLKGDARPISSSISQAGATPGPQAEGVGKTRGLELGIGSGLPSGK